MSYTISPAEPLCHEIAHVARAQLEDSIEILERHPDGIHEAVHQARKSFKRIRGLYRLVRTGDKAFQKRENARIRDMARTLSAFRDAAAMVETIDHLGTEGFTPRERQVLGRIKAQLEARRDEVVRRETDLADRIATAIDTCRAAIAALDDLAFNDSPKRAAAIIAKGWETTYGAAQVPLNRDCVVKDTMIQDGTPARGAPEISAQGLERADAFHELRKRSQDHWMHARLLRDLWPSMMRERRDETKRLVDVLGHACDLSVLLELKERAPDEVGKPADLAVMEAIVTPRMEALRRKAVERAAALYAEDARFAGERIRVLWRHDAAKR